MSSRSPIEPLPFWLLWSVGILFWAITLTVASPLDLRLSVQVADRSSTFASLVASFGEWPAWGVLIASLVVLITGRGPGSSWLRPLACTILVLALIHPLAITQSLKYFWGRVRFIELAGDFSRYTSFYIPAGIGAGSSFPSGHVAMAFVTAAIPCFLARTGNWLLALLSLLAVLVYGFGVAWGRILAGAHYLTDCLFSAGLSWQLGVLLVRLLFRKDSVATPSSQTFRRAP